VGGAGGFLGKRFLPLFNRPKTAHEKKVPSIVSTFKYR
jgi:hypothetical protein